ncbi:hypothetical protein ACSFB5_12440, partial [Glaesserella parasuis]|uniref:hypothetical protein n=1 Tax=Glaesserella parasuis TaxID=738 RepID=UPI003F2DDE07
SNSLAEGEETDDLPSQLGAENVFLTPWRIEEIEGTLSFVRDAMSCDFVPPSEMKSSPLAE